MNFWKNVDSELNFQAKTRKQLADEIGFDVTCISSGIRRNNIPAADTAIKIARALNVSLEYLLDMNDTKASKIEIDTSLPDDLRTQILLYKKYSMMIENLEKLNSKSLHTVENLVENIAELTKKHK